MGILKFTFLGVEWNMLPLALMAWCGFAMYLFIAMIEFGIDNNTSGFLTCAGVICVWATINMNLATHFLKK